MPRFQWTNPFKPTAVVESTALNDAALDRQFIEGHLDPVYLLDLQGNIIDCNDKLAFLLGYAKDDLLRHFAHFTTDEEVARILPHFQRVLRGTEETYTAQAIHRNGRRLTLRITNIPRFENQLIVGVYGIARDVTDDLELKEELDRLLFERALLHEAPGLVSFTVQPDLSIQDGSDAFVRSFGQHVTTWDQLVRRIDLDDRHLVERAYEALHDGQTEAHELTFCLRGLESEEHYIGKFIRFADTVRGFFSNVTAHVTLAEMNEANASRLHDLYHYTDASIYRRDVQTGELEFYTDGFEQLFGISQETMHLHPTACHHVIHENDRLKVRAAFQKAHDGAESRIVYRTTHDGTRWIEERVIPKTDDHGNVQSVISVARDVTRLKTQEEQIWQLAMHDALTALPNRSLFFRELEEWMDHHAHVAILTLSFNAINTINRDFGYQVGDDWIVATTSALLHHVPTGSFVGHIGGDEYGILIPGFADEASLIAHCRPLLRMGDTSIHVGPYEWVPSISIGVSRYPNDSDVPTELLQYANTALGRTLSTDTDSIVFYASHFDIDSYRRHQLGNDLRRAIDEGELFLEFQPKVDAWSGRIVGAEALVRWQHPEWGRIPPNDFIPLSEESDLHLKLADWVLNETCRHLQEWQMRSLPVVPVSINVSPKRLLHGNYLETVLRALRRHDVAPSLIEIEILETDVLGGNPKIHETLHMLSDANIRVALDDFGTGYSSLSYLQRYPIKTIKIDQQFATDLHENRKTQGIVRTILFMAEEFGMDVVIEGVETLDQLQMLRQLNCRIVQGYLFSRPLGRTDYEAALEERFLMTTEIGPNGGRQAFSLEAAITIHKLHGRTIDVGSTPILLTKSSLTSLHFYATVRLPVMETIELKVLLPYRDETIELFVRPVGMIELENGIIDYEARYLTKSDAHRVITALQEQVSVSH